MPRREGRDYNNPVSLGNFIKAAAAAAGKTLESFGQQNSLLVWACLFNCQPQSVTGGQAAREKGRERERGSEAAATPTDCIQLAATVPHSHPQS